MVPTNKLHEHLIRDKYLEPFEPHELSHAVLFVYTALASAAYDGADIFIIKQNGFEWSKDNKQLGTFLGQDYAKPYPKTYAECFQVILRRDEIVSRCATILSDAPDKTVIQLQYLE